MRIKPAHSESKTVYNICYTQFFVLSSWVQRVEKTPSEREGMNRTPWNGAIDTETTI